MAHLFIELHDNELEYLTEEDSGVKKHYIQGTFLQANIRNRNGRLYPVGVLEQEVERYLNENIKNNRAFGELGHPEGPKINLDRVSHLITELYQQGNDFIGKAKLVDTPMGNIAIGLLNSGASLGVSSRGMGTIKKMKGGIMEIQNDFRLATAADLVANPSAPGAFVQSILEQKEWFFNETTGTWQEEALNVIQNILKDSSAEEIERRKLEIFESYIEAIKNSNL